MLTTSGLIIGEVLASESLSESACHKYPFLDTLHSFIVVLWNVQLMNPYVSNTVWTSQYGNGQGYGGVYLCAFSLTPGWVPFTLTS